jgi:hypothetical protein
MYTVTVVDGTLDGGGTTGNFDDGDIVTIISNAPATKFVFASWTSDVAVTFADPSATTTTFTMPAEDVVVTATYNQVIFTVTVVRGTGSGDYTVGDTVSVDARAPYKWEQFYAWTGTTFTDPTSSSTTFIMPAQDVTATATFRDVKSRAQSPVLDAAESTINFNSGFVPTRNGLAFFAMTKGGTGTGYFNAYVDGDQVSRFSMTKPAEHRDGNKGQSSVILVRAGQTLTFNYGNLDLFTKHFVPFKDETSTVVYPMPYVNYNSPDLTTTSASVSVNYPAYYVALSNSFAGMTAAGFLVETIAADGSVYYCGGAYGYNVPGWASFTASVSGTSYSQDTPARFRVEGGLSVGVGKVYKLYFEGDDPERPWPLRQKMGLFEHDNKGPFLTDGDTFVSCYTRDPQGPAAFNIMLDGHTIHTFTENTSNGVDQSVWFFSGSGQLNTRDKYQAHYTYQAPVDFADQSYIPDEAREDDGYWYSHNRSAASIKGKGTFEIMDVYESQGQQHTIWNEMRTSNGGVGQGDPPEIANNSTIWYNRNKIGQDKDV